MVPAVSVIAGPRPSMLEHNSVGERFGGSCIVAGSSAAGRQIRARIGELDRSTCQTRLSQRKFLIQLQADSACNFRSGSERIRDNTMNHQWSGKVDDWD